MPTIWLLLVCTLIFCLVKAVVLVLLFRGRRRNLMIQQSIEWQMKKAQKFASGWQPQLWDSSDPTVTEDEKVAALVAYASGKPIPLSGKERRSQQW
jgi:hypothetical protein